MNITTKKNITHIDYMKIAIPFILSTVTQPLLGAVDTAVVGKLEDASYIAGVSIGTVIFNTMYWLFGFLRVSTTGFSAQALGRDSSKDRTTSFFRPGAMALAIGLFFLVFQNPIFKISMLILSPEANVARFTKVYFDVLIWGSPLVLLNYVMLGWLMGQARLKASLCMQITTNILNIILDYLFVYGMGMDVKGVAIATLISQFVGVVIGVIFIRKYGRFDKEEMSLKKIFDKNSIISILKVNSDLMIRTICLLIQTNIFAASSALLGTNILSANSILLQIQSIISYSFDGLANTASVYAGKSIGQKSKELLVSACKRTAEWVVIFIVITTVGFALLRNDIIYLFTDIESIIVLVKQYDFWILLFPVLSGAGLAFYGIFTGTAETKPIRNSALLALILCLLTWKIGVPRWGNHGLWMSLLAFYFGRTIFLLPQLKKVFNKI